MKVIVTSDSHGNINVLKKIMEKEKDFDLFLDAGDSELDPKTIYPILSVKGNRDYLIDNNFLVKDLNGVRFYVTHGAGYFFNIDYLVSNAETLGCNVAIFGHTHMPFLKIIDGVVVLNPGSVSLPRGGSRASYALITYETKEDINIEIKEINF